MLLFPVGEDHLAVLYLFQRVSAHVLPFQIELRPVGAVYPGAYIGQRPLERQGIERRRARGRAVLLFHGKIGLEGIRGGKVAQPAASAGVGKRRRPSAHPGGGGDVGVKAQRKQDAFDHPAEA